jgi:nucleotide-binding universal stress UspA family protein
VTGHLRRECDVRIQQERIEMYVDTATRVAEQEIPGLEIDHQLVMGGPHAVLVSESRRAQLLVVGSREVGCFAGPLMGSVAVTMATYANCPVVIVRGAERGPAEVRVLPVVVGVDGSPADDGALAFAYKAAEARRVPLVAVHSFRDLLVDPMLVPLLDWEAIELHQRQRLAERLARRAQMPPDLAVELVVTLSFPTHVLLRQATRAQLVVVGSRRCSAGAARGSVSAAVVRRAACPVAVVPSPEGDGLKTD